MTSPHNSIQRQKPLRVLVYAPYVGHGGVRRFTLSLLRAMIKIADPNEWQFSVLSQPIDGKGCKIDWPKNTFIPIYGDHIKDNLGNRLCDFLQANQNRFWRKLKKYAADADIIWLPQPWWTLRCVDEEYDLKGHIVPTLHDFAFDHLNWGGLFGRRFRDEARNIINISSRVIFSSQYTARHAETSYAMLPNKGSVVYQANFLPEAFTASETRLSNLKHIHHLPDKYWLAFHTMGHKDPESILKALAETKKHLHKDYYIPLVIAGIGSECLIPQGSGDANQSNHLYELISKLGIIYGEDYIATGFIDDADIASLYAGSYASIVASKSEAGLSASIFESFATKTPLIHSNIPPFIERLGTDNRYALSFQVGDSNALANAMISILFDYKKAEEKALIAFHAFCYRNWLDVANDYLNIFLDVTKDGPNKSHWISPGQSIQKIHRKEKLRIRQYQVSYNLGGKTSLKRLERSTPLPPLVNFLLAPIQKLKMKLTK